MPEYLTPISLLMSAFKTLFSPFTDSKEFSLPVRRDALMAFAFALEL